MSHLPIKAAISFLLLSFFLSPPIIDAEPILDSNGEAVTSSSQYYVVSVSWAGGGGLNYVQKQDYYSRCPTFLVSQSSDNHCGTDYGLPLSFNPINSENITTSGDVSVGFSFRPPRVPYNCIRPTMGWKVVDDGVQLGASGAYDEDESVTTFKIEKNDAYGYRFSHCPTSGLEQAECKNLAAVYDRRLGFRRMAVVDDDIPPFQMMFVKANGGRHSPY